MQHWYPAALSFILFGAFSISCGGGPEDANGGGLVGFSTGTPQASPVPSDGTSVGAPVVTGVVITNNPAKNGEPLHVNVSFSDPQGDIAAVHAGIAGQSSHSVIAVTGIGAQTSGTLFIELKPASKASGTYTLVVSITDVAGHNSKAVSVPFTILNPDGTLPSAGVDAGASASSPDSAQRQPGVVNTPANLDPALIGKWVYDDGESYSSWTFNADGSCVQTVSTGDYDWEWAIENGQLKLFVRSGKPAYLRYKIEGNKLYFWADTYEAWGLPFTKM